MTYETAVRTWASEQFDFPAEAIASVDFGYEDGDNCPTCGYDGYPYAVIHFTDGKHRQEPMQYEFAELVTALVNVAVREAD